MFTLCIDMLEKNLFISYFFVFEFQLDFASNVAKKKFNFI